MTRYVFRPVAFSDLPLLGGWLRAPHVARWWGDAARELAQIEAHLSRPWMRCLIAELDGEDFGYLQIYDPGADPERVWPELPESARSVDMLIGEARFLGRGHGSGIVRQLSDDLLDADEVTEVWGDPAPDNIASVRAFAAAGFDDMGLATKPWGRLRFMRKLRRSLDH